MDATAGKAAEIADKNYCDYKQYMEDRLQQLRQEYSKKRSESSFNEMEARIAFKKEYEAMQQRLNELYKTKVGCL